MLYKIISGPVLSSPRSSPFGPWKGYRIIIILIFDYNYIILYPIII